MTWQRVGDNANVYNQLQRIDVADGNLGATGEDDTVHIPAEMNAHVHVFEGDTTLSSNTTLGSATLEEITMARFEGDLTIDSGATLDINDRGWGLCLLVEGDLTIADGTISMNQSGYGIDPNDVGYPVVVLPDVENEGTTALLPLYGGEADVNTGGTGVASAATEGGTGGAGSNGCCGGGGSGAASHGDDITAVSVSGVGTLFCGGPGGGGVLADTGSVASSQASNFGKAGGDAQTQVSDTEGGGGAGNPGGSGVDGGNNGSDGAGGLIIAIVTGNIDIQASGSIESDGAAGGDAGSHAGGGSGGGAINLYHGGTFTNSGSLSVSGGTGGSGNTNANGGDGGTGSTTTTSVTL